MTPLFDKVLLERLQNKDSKTQEILSQYLSDVITKTSKESPEDLSRSLQSVISPAISKEIENNKETMIDALYPIMGGMISKYVTQSIKEMMDTINKKIEDGLSSERIKRKVKAKFTGVSESELLLEESGDATISSIFIIHKETSILVAESHLEDQQIDDAHMVASMASAIKDFINDWIEKNESMNEVQLLSYGNATLYIESAGSVYLIAFLDSEPDHALRKDINEFFATLLKEYAPFFQRFVGDDSSTEVEKLTYKIDTFLNKEDFSHIVKKKENSKLKWIIGSVLGLAIVIYALTALVTKFEEYGLQSKIEKHGYLVDVSLDDERVKLSGRVENLSDVDKIVQIVRAHTHNPIENQLLIPSINLAKMIKKEKEARGKELLKINNILKKMTESVGTR